MRSSEDTLDHRVQNGNEPKEEPRDDGERGKKKPEEKGAVGFWHS